MAVRANGTREWRLDGRRRRLDGLAIERSNGARHFGVLEPGTSQYVAVLRLGYMSAGKWQVGAEDRVLYIPVESIQWVEPHVGSLP